jgi:hypothetical protein
LLALTITMTRIVVSPFQLKITASTLTSNAR